MCNACRNVQTYGVHDLPGAEPIRQSSAISGKVNHYEETSKNDTTAHCQRCGKTHSVTFRGGVSEKIVTCSCGALVSFKRTDSETARLANSGLLNDFVSQQNGAWSHEDWLRFLDRVRLNGFTTLPDHEVGRLLEEEKARWAAVRAEPRSGTRKPFDVKLHDIRALHVGVVNTSLFDDEAGELALDLMQRWNPRLADALARTPVVAERLAVWGFVDSSMDALIRTTAEQQRSRFSDCNVILQSGRIEVFRRSTGTRIPADVILVTYVRNYYGRPTAVVGDTLALTPVL
jgi:hypothetical protein